jgi:hypothetical protein
MQARLERAARTQLCHACQQPFKEHETFHATPQGAGGGVLLWHPQCAPGAPAAFAGVAAAAAAAASRGSGGGSASAAAPAPRVAATPLSGSAPAAGAPDAAACKTACNGRAGVHACDGPPLRMPPARADATPAPSAAASEPQAGAASRAATAAAAAALAAAGKSSEKKKKKKSKNENSDADIPDLLRCEGWRRARACEAHLR